MRDLLLPSLLLLSIFACLSGCATEGEWFPKPDKLDKPVRKQLPQDKTNRSESGLPGLIVGVLNDIVN